MAVMAQDMLQVRRVWNGSLDEELQGIQQNSLLFSVSTIVLMHCEEEGWDTPLSRDRDLILSVSFPIL